MVYAMVCGAVAVNGPTNVAETTVYITPDTSTFIRHDLSEWTSRQSSNTTPISIVISHSTVVTSILFPDMDEIHGSLVLYDLPNLQSISFPKLTRLHGTMNVTSPSILSVPMLVRVDGSVYITNISAWQAPLLQSLQSLSIVTTRILQLDLPAIERVRQTITIHENPLLRNVSLPLLTEINGDLYVDRNPQLPSIDLHSVSMIGGTLHVTGVRLLQMNSIRDIRGGAESNQTNLCGDIQGWKMQGVIQGRTVCMNAVISSAAPATPHHLHWMSAIFAFLCLSIFRLD